MSSFSHHRPRKLHLERLEDRRLLASMGTLLNFDFNGATIWPVTPGFSSPGVAATQSQSAVGTVDIAGGTTKSGGVNFAVLSAPNSGYWKSELNSGPLVLSNTEANLGKLTLSFDLSASTALPVKVIVDSYTPGGVRTGSLESMIIPAAANSFQRFAVDLSTMSASGTGTFDPTSPNIGFRFELSSQAGWTATSPVEIQLDNVNYSKPAYFVRPSSDGGSNSNNGRTEATAFATLQKALDVSQPGDIILLMNGTYDGNYSGTFNGMQALGWVKKGGAPDAWLSIKNYPGHTPTINTGWTTSAGALRAAWNAIQIGANSSAPSTGPAVAYVEVRGLRIVGNALLDGTPAFDAAKGTANALTNNNGISVEGRYEANKPHHIRLADNRLEYLSGGGLNALEADYLLYENNVVQNTSWWTQYATSGISVYSSVNFDQTDNSYKRIVRNNLASGNETKVRWTVTGNFSDGNGIIIDVNRTSGSTPTIKGRTLVQNNVVFNNGGSGIHTFKGDKVDIVNNSAYLNSASPNLQYGQIFAEQSVDVKIHNNILVAPVPGAGQPNEPVNGGTAPSGSNGIEYRNNIFWGGNLSPFSSTINGNRVLNPLFANPSIDPAVADFRVQSTSPAINQGLGTAIIPAVDLLGNRRNGVTDIGAYEFYAIAPTIVSAAAATPNPINDGETTLTVSAGDNNGPANLSYTWSTITKPVGAADPLFIRNGSIVSRTAEATFSQIGNYTLQVTVSDGQANVATSTVSVTVSRLSPADFDQNGNVDGADFLRWQLGFGITAPTATIDDGDADGDLDVDGDDLTAWQVAFQSMGTSAATLAASASSYSASIPTGIPVSAEYLVAPTARRPSADPQKARYAHTSTSESQQTLTGRLVASSPNRRARMLELAREPSVLDELWSGWERPCLIGLK